MKKLLVVLALALLWSGKANADRGAKAMSAINYTTNLSTVTVKAAVLYGIVISSSPSTDWLTIYDSNTAVGYTAGGVAAGTTGQRVRILLSTGSVNAPYTFDPPLQFEKGIIAGVSNAADAVTLIWEPGRIIQGY